MSLIYMIDSRLDDVSEQKFKAWRTRMLISSWSSPWSI